MPDDVGTFFSIGAIGATITMLAALVVRFSNSVASRDKSHQELVNKLRTVQEERLAVKDKTIADLNDEIVRLRKALWKAEDEAAHYRRLAGEGR